MEKKEIKLGLTCLTEIDKNFTYHGTSILIKKGTHITVCDDFAINKGFVLVEIEGYDEVFDYHISELTFPNKQFSRN